VLAHETGENEDQSSGSSRRGNSQYYDEYTERSGTALTLVVIAYRSFNKVRDRTS